MNNCPRYPTDRVSLILAAVELMAVVEDVLVGGVQAGLYTVLHHLAGSRWTLQFLDLGTSDIDLSLA